jgi:hypothetical protein
MTNEDVAPGASRRAPRQGIGGSPVGSTLSIVLAVVAVIAGFLILQDLTEDDPVAGGSTDNSLDDQTTTTVFDTGVATTIVVATTTTLPFVTAGATVVVANGNTLGGSAGRMSETLAVAGFDMGAPTDGNDTIDESIVYYDPGNTAAEAVAQSVARALGGLTVVVVGTPAPTESGSLDDAGVLVLLGNSQADKTLEQLQEEAGLATVEVGTSPAVAGGDVIAPIEPVTSEAGG